MNRLILLPSDFTKRNRVCISDRRADHIRSVLKTGVGDSIRFGVLNGPVGVASFIEDNESGISLDLVFSDGPDKQNEPFMKPLPCTLVLALPRPKVANRLIQTICSLGVGEIHLINTARVDKSYWKSHYLEFDQIQHQLLLGLEQSGSTYMPSVVQHRLFRPFVEDHFPTLIEGKLPLLAHPRAEQKCPGEIDKSSVLTIGPEGGFTDFELDLLEQQGAMPVSMGDRILRVETAVPALIGRLYG